MGLKGKTLILQGFGQMGYYYAKYMCEYGVKLIGVAGTTGCIYDSNGIGYRKI